ncbi:DNA topoisomerase, partial [Limosilactobacillus ingluviei]
KQFKPEEYWTIDAEFAHGKDRFQASFYGEGGKKVRLHNNDDVQAVLGKLDKRKNFNITKVVRKERKRQPQPPYTTSTMQQDANRQLNFRTRKTMMAAQMLYEGIDIKQGAPVGLITYMRTDSTRIASIAKHEASQFIHEKYGGEYAAIKPVKGKLPEGAQDAHEAIRPTSVY